MLPELRAVVTRGSHPLMAATQAAIAANVIWGGCLARSSLALAAGANGKGHSPESNTAPMAAFVTWAA
jgi:hypothetical protein